MQTITLPQQTISRTNIILFTVCFISSVFGGIVSVLMSVYLPVAVGDLMGPSQSADLTRISAYINALFLFGWASGGFTWGFISDWLGRKKALLLAIGCYAWFTLLTGFMPDWYGVMICRFFTGFGVGGVLVVAFTLMSEVWPAHNKTVYIGILSIAFPVGIFSAGLINYFVSSWRAGFLVGLIPLLIAFSGIWLIEESETWKTDKAVNRQSGNAFTRIFSTIQKKELLKGSLIFGSMLIGLWAIFSWLPSWVQTLVENGNGQKERSLSMMLMGIGGLTGGFFSGKIAQALGFRKAMLLCFLSCFLVSFILFKTNHHFSLVIYPQVVALALFFGASQGILSAYIPQLFPTGTRATATGFCFNIGRLVTATAVLFIGVLETSLGGYGNAIFLFSLVFLAGMIVTYLEKEEKQ